MRVTRKRVKGERDGRGWRGVRKDGIKCVDVGTKDAQGNKDTRHGWMDGWLDGGKESVIGTRVSELGVDQVWKNSASGILRKIKSLVFWGGKNFFFFSVTWQSSQADQTIVDKQTNTQTVQSPFRKVLTAPRDPSLLKVITDLTPVCPKAFKFRWSLQGEGVCETFGIVKH